MQNGPSWHEQDIIGVEPPVYELYQEGYLSKKDISSQTVFGGADPWNRKYFVLRGYYLLFYDSVRHFEDNPSQPTSARPIVLEGYALKANVERTPYTLTLEPVDKDDDRRVWELRCDTLDELREWYSALIYYTNISEYYVRTIQVLPKYYPSTSLSLCYYSRLVLN